MHINISAYLGCFNHEYINKYKDLENYIKSHIKNYSESGLVSDLRLFNENIPILKI